MNRLQAIVLSAITALSMTGSMLLTSASPVEARPPASICIKNPNHPHCPKPPPTPTPTPTIAPTPTPTLNPTPTPTLAPTPTPTIRPTPTPTIAPTPTPTSTPPTTCPTSLQSAVTGAVAGSTLDVRGCGPYHESVTVSKPLTLIGASIDGDHTRTICLAIRNTHDVVIGDSRVVECHNPAQQGAIDSDNVANLTITRTTVTDCDGAGISAVGGQNATVSESQMSFCRQEGYHSNTVGGTGFSMIANSIHDNNYNNDYDPGWEAGGGKMALAGGTWDGNDVYNNHGPGLWCDIDCHGLIVKNNRVHDNLSMGIFFEISDGAQIYNNKVWRNHNNTGWCYDGGITISSSDNAEVYGNILAWNTHGLTALSQNRTDGTRDWSISQNINLHDNTVISQGGSFVAGFCDDHGGTLFQAANNNRGSGNDYWVGVAEPTTDRFAWAGGRATLSAYNSTPGEEGGIYITTAQRDSILIQNGMPTTP